MIAKISHGSSLYGVLAYNQLKVDERHADVLFTSRIIEPQGDNPYTIGHLSRSFGDYLTANRKTEKPVLHISLNPDPKDCLSEERFVSLAEEYMRRMGFGRPALYRLSPQRHRAGAPAHRLRPGGRNRAVDFRQL